MRVQICAVAAFLCRNGAIVHKKEIMCQNAKKCGRMSWIAYDRICYVFTTSVHEDLDTVSALLVPTFHATGEGVADVGEDGGLQAKLYENGA